ncbi:MAG: ATP-binding protein, partial [Chitinophagaceae bacterium]|nr:ATP-binding protein [Chitinophagaceae bacterium]
MNEESLEKMNSMRLSGMHTAFKACMESNRANAFTNDELVHHLVVSEWDDRRHRALQRSLKNARFRYPANMEQIDYGSESGLDKNQLQRLSCCEFITKGQDLFITGSTGTGKSFLASALGHQACLLGYKVFYAGTAK